LETAVRNLAEVHSLRRARAERRRKATADEGVPGVLAVVRYLEPQPVVEEAGVKTDLPFRGFLRLQVDITGATDCNRRHRFALDRCNRRAEELLRRAEARHQTRAAPRATEAQRRKGIGLWEEVFLTDHP